MTRNKQKSLTFWNKPFPQKGTKLMKFEKAWRLLQFAICNLQFSNNKFILSLSSTMISDMSEWIRTSYVIKIKGTFSLFLRHTLCNFWCFFFNCYVQKTNCFFISIVVFRKVFLAVFHLFLDKRAVNFCLFWPN